MNIARLFWDSDSRFGDRPLVLFNGTATTHDVMADQVSRLTGLLRGRGVGSGDRVIIAMNNSVEWLVSFLAVLGTGAICVPVNPGLRPREMCNIANHCKPAFAIVDAELEGCFGEATASFPRLLRGVSTGNWHELVARAQPDRFVAEVADADPALIFYTSGTTGTPKGVLLSHGAERYAAIMSAEYIGITSRDCSIVLGSLAFIYPLIVNALSAISSGATIVLQDRFHPKLVADAIERFGVTILMGVPTMYAMLTSYAEQNRCDFSSVRVAFSGGASLSDALCNAARKNMGFEIFDFWGLTECTPVTTFDLKRDKRREPESAGRAMPGTAFKIVDDDLNELPIGTVGEIMLTGPMIMSEYYLNPTATKETIIDGWVRSGDLGKTDARGFLYIVGRKKDLIIRGGANIYPVDVEEALYSHDQVVECAVVGKPHTLFGETVVAYVVRKSPGLTSDDLISYCQTQLADYKVPSDVLFVDQLPKGPTGKILRQQLRAEIATL